MDQFQEKPIAVTSVVERHGANAHSQMDENSIKTGLFANGVPLLVYEHALSTENVEHIRVSAYGAPKVQWIRCWERDGSNPLVNKLTYLVTDGEQIAQAINGLAQVIREKKFS